MMVCRMQQWAGPWCRVYLEVKLILWHAVEYGLYLLVRLPDVHKCLVDLSLIQGPSAVVLA